MVDKKVATQYNQLKEKCDKRGWDTDDVYTCASILSRLRKELGPDGIIRAANLILAVTDPDAIVVDVKKHQANIYLPMRSSDRPRFMNRWPKPGKYILINRP